MMRPSNGKFAMNKWEIFSLLVSLWLVAGVLRSQTCGNPAGAAGKGLLTMTANGAYQTLEQGSQRVVSKRYFLKTQYGLAPWLDVYGLLGSTQVTMKNNSPTGTDYRDKYRFAYGAGLNVLLNPAKPKPKRRTARMVRTSPQPSVYFWGGASIIRYPAEAVFDEAKNGILHEYMWKYDCREVTGHAGFLFPYRFLKFYVAGIGWAIQRLDAKREFLLGIPNDPIYKGEAKATYQSGLWTGGMAGVQVDLQQNYSLTVEAIAFNKSDYRIMIGISQTGIRTW
jgi:hypothetical protein